MSSVAAQLLVKTSLFTPALAACRTMFIVPLTAPEIIASVSVPKRGDATWMTASTPCRAWVKSCVAMSVISTISAFGPNCSLSASIFP